MKAELSWCCSANRNFYFILNAVNYVCLLFSDLEPVSKVNNKSQLVSDLWSIVLDAWWSKNLEKVEITIFVVCGVEVEGGRAAVPSARNFSFNIDGAGGREWKGHVSLLSFFVRRERMDMDVKSSVYTQFRRHTAVALLFPKCSFASPIIYDYETLQLMHYISLHLNRLDLK